MQLFCYPCKSKLNSKRKIEKMVSPEPSLKSCKNSQSTTVQHSIEINQLLPNSQNQMIDMIRKNLGSFKEAGSVLAASFRRLENFTATYSSEKNIYFNAYCNSEKRTLGGVGVGPLAGLPPSDGIGEIRELVIDRPYRNRGVGAVLIEHAVNWAQRHGYETLYLETTTQMITAQRLFKRFGFKPITDQNNGESGNHALFPCYFMLSGL